MLLVLTTGLLVGFVLKGAYSICLIGVPVIGGWIAIFCKKMNTKAIITEEYILVTTHKTEKKFDRNDIVQVTFGKSRLMFNRCLIIIFRDGYRMFWDQTEYWGLTYAYEILHERISKTD